MPLPEANNYSQRIYELLKETDLENLSYAQFQAVAEKLFIEPENEDEMRRLVLVQLARMAVRGDWDGFLSGSSGIGGSIATDQVAFGSGTDAIEGSDNFKFTGTSVLELVNTLDIGGTGAAGIIKNSNSNQDLELKVTGTGNVRVKNDTTNQASQLNVQGNGSGDPIISLSNDTKSVSIQCDTNQKLSVKGGTDEFVLDVSSATGGITFPDGTTQTTAATGGSSGVIGAFPDLSSFTPTAGGEIIHTSTMQPGSYLRLKNLSISTWGTTYYYYFPITVNTTKTYTTAGMMASSWAAGNEVTIAIYDSADDTLLPQNKLASTVVTLNTVGKITNTLTVESGQSMALTKGDFVWMAMKFTAVADDTKGIRANDDLYNYALGGNIVGTSIGGFNSIVSFNAPATFASSDFVATFQLDYPFLIWS